MLSFCFNSIPCFCTKFLGGANKVGVGGFVGLFDLVGVGLVCFGCGGHTIVYHTFLHLRTFPLLAV
jgi:hypothetical protein